MSHLSRNDYASALRVLAQVEAQAGDLDSFVQATVRALNNYLAVEVAALSICDLSGGETSSADRPAVERLLADRRVIEGEETGGDCHRRTGPEYEVAVPLFRNQKTLVSLILKRREPAFGERDRERLDLLRPHLAFLYQHASQAEPAAISVGFQSCPPQTEGDGDGDPAMIAGTDPSCLTPREGEVMYWLSCGKTDAQIAALLFISPRTVQKHLEHVYVKLGVETRTAAVMRSIALNGHFASPQRPYILRGNGSSSMARH